MDEIVNYRIVIHEAVHVCNLFLRVHVGHGGGGASVHVVSCFISFIVFLFCSQFISHYGKVSSRSPVIWFSDWFYLNFDWFWSYSHYTATIIIFLYVWF